MARPFPEVYYDRVVPRQQLLNKALHCVSFQNKRLPLNICFLSRQFFMNCTFTFANIINSWLALFSARFDKKLVLNGCFEYELWLWFPFNMRRSVAQLKTRTRTHTRTGSKPPSSNTNSPHQMHIYHTKHNFAFDVVHLHLIIWLCVWCGKFLCDVANVYFMWHLLASVDINKYLFWLLLLMEDSSTKYYYVYYYYLLCSIGQLLKN